MARDVRMPVAGVVENMSTLVCEACAHESALFGTGGGARVAEALAAPLLGRVPLDMPLRAAGDLGVPAVVSAPGTPSAQELARIATDLPVVRRSLVGRPLPLAVV
jgi:ATP-binding protein involved in chromosome partitioning